MRSSDTPYGISDVARWDMNARWLGLSPLQLMENAGAAVARIATERYGHAQRIAVIAGIGNNGGDGFVAARHLAFTHEVTVYLIGRPERLKTPEAIHNFALIADSPFIRTIALDDEESIRALDLCTFDLLVDALLGAGGRGAPRGVIGAAIQAMNRCRGRVPILSIDLPSGYPHEGYVSCDLAVTFQWDKREYDNFSREIATIGFLPELAHLVGPADVAPLLERRGEHKGQNGDLLIIGGSRDYPGAPLLAALAAAPFVDRVWVTAFRHSTTPLPPMLIPVWVDAEDGQGRFTPSAADTVLQAAERVDAVVIGPGLGRSTGVLQFVETVLTALDRPHVVDADALYALPAPADRTTSVVNSFRKRLITPHGGEFRALLGRFDLASDKNAASSSTIQHLKDRARIVQRLARRLQATVLQKDAIDIIADATSWRYNITGNRGLTAGGTGDALAGLAGAFLARGATPQAASGAAAFLVGLAGESMAEKQGLNFTAEDVVRVLPIVAERVRSGALPPRRRPT